MLAVYDVTIERLYDVRRFLPWEQQRNWRQLILLDVRDHRRANNGRINHDETDPLIRQSISLTFTEYALLSLRVAIRKISREADQAGHRAQHRNMSATFLQKRGDHGQDIESPLQIRRGALDTISNSWVITNSKYASRVDNQIQRFVYE